MRQTKVPHGPQVADLWFRALQKAFDTVNHEISREKLNHNGIRSKENDWFCSFFSHRRQCWSIKGFFALTKIARSNITQASTFCDDKDPPWMNDEIKILIKRKNWLFQCQRKPVNLTIPSLTMLVSVLLHKISNAVNSSKLKYHERLALIASWKPTCN